MNGTVDTRIVELKFDNKDFERNVQKSLKSIDEINESLEFEGIQEGAKNLTNAFTGSSGIVGAISNVETKFSSLEIAGKRVIENLVDSAMSAVTKITKSLITDPISSGFSRKGEKDKSINTIVNAVKDQYSSEEEAIEHVTNSVEKLMWFSDETSYSFADMMSNISKFTSVGADLDSATKAMMGMAAATAAAGQGSESASRVMYNMSQAYGSGYVKKQDWNSVTNANASSKQLKQTMIEAAVDTSVPTGKKGKDSSKTLYAKVDKKTGETKYYTKKGNKEVNYSNFEEMLSKGWLTAEIMEDGFGKYAEFAEAMYDAMDKNSKSATEMLNIISEGTAEGATEEQVAEAQKLLDELNEAAGLSGENALTLENINDNLGLVSFQAAQEAHSFQDAKDAINDVMATGWMEVFDSIFGNFKDSAKFWTTFANDVSGFLYEIPGSLARIINMADTHLTIWEDGEEMSGMQYLLKSVTELWSHLTEVLGAVNGAFQDVFGTEEEQATSLMGFIKDFGAFADSLKPSEETLEKIRNAFGGLFVVLKIGLGIIKFFIKLWAKSLGKIFNNVLNIASKLGKRLVKLNKKWKIKKTGEKIQKSLEKPLEAVSDLVSQIGDKIKNSKLVKSLSESWDNFWKKLGNVESIGDIFLTIGDLVGDVFGDIKDSVLEFVGEHFPKLSSAFESIGEYFESFKKTKLYKTFSGLFEKLRNGDTGIQKWISGFVDADDKIQYLKDSWDDLKKSLTDGIDKVKGKFKEWKDAWDEGGFSGLFDKLKEDFSDLKDKFVEWIKGLFKTTDDETEEEGDEFTDLTEQILSNIKTKISTWWNDLKTKISSKVTELWTSLVEKIKNNPVLASILAKFNELKAKIQNSKIGKFLSGFAEKVKTGNTGIQKWIKGFVDAEDKVAYLKGTWDKVKKSFTNGIEKIKGKFEEWKKTFQESGLVGLIKQLGVDFTSLKDSVIGWIKGLFGGSEEETEEGEETLSSTLIDKLNDVKAKVLEWFEQAKTDVAGWFTGLWNSIIGKDEEGNDDDRPFADRITSYLDGVLESLNSAKESIVAWFDKLFYGESSGDTDEETGETNSIVEKVNSYKEKVITALSTAWEEVKKFVSGLWASIFGGDSEETGEGEASSSALSSSGPIEEWSTSIINDLDTAAGKIKEWFANIKEKIFGKESEKGTEEAGGTAKEKLDGIKDKISESLSSLVGKIAKWAGIIAGVALTIAIIIMVYNSYVAKAGEAKAKASEAAAEKWKQIGNTFLKIAASVLLIIAAIVLVEKLGITREQFADGFAKVSMVLVALLVFIGIVGLINKVTGGTSTDLTGVGTAALGMAASLLILALVIQVFYQMIQADGDTGKLLLAVGIVAVLLVALGLMAGLARGFSDNSKAKNNTFLEWIGIAIVLMVLCNAVKKLADIPEDKLITATAVLAALMLLVGAMAYFCKYLKDEIDDGKDALKLVAVIAGVIAIAYVVNMLADALVKLSGIDSRTLITSGVVLGVLSAVAVALVLACMKLSERIKTWGDAGRVLLTIATLIAIAFAMKIMAEAVEILADPLIRLSKEDWKGILAGAGGIAIIFMAMAGALKLAGKSFGLSFEGFGVKTSIEYGAKAENFKVLAEAASTIADALIKLSPINLASVGVGGVVLAGILWVMAKALKIEGKTIEGSVSASVKDVFDLSVSGSYGPKAENFKMLAEAASTVADALVKLAPISLASVGVGGVVLAGILWVMAKALKIEGKTIEGSASASVKDVFDLSVSGSYGPKAENFTLLASAAETVANALISLSSVDIDKVAAGGGVLAGILLAMAAALALEGKDAEVDATASDVEGDQVSVYASMKSNAEAFLPLAQVAQTLVDPLMTLSTANADSLLAAGGVISAILVAMGAGLGLSKDAEAGVTASDAEGNQVSAYAETKNNVDAFLPLAQAAQTLVDPLMTLSTANTDSLLAAGGVISAILVAMGAGLGLSKDLEAGATVSDAEGNQVSAYAETKNNVDSFLPLAKALTTITPSLLVLSLVPEAKIATAGAVISAILLAMGGALAISKDGEVSVDFSDFSLCASISNNSQSFIDMANALATIAPELIKLSDESIDPDKLATATTVLNRILIAIAGALALSKNITIGEDGGFLSITNDSGGIADAIIAVASLVDPLLALSEVPTEKVTQAKQAITDILGALGELFGSSKDTSVLWGLFSSETNVGELTSAIRSLSVSLSLYLIPILPELEAANGSTIKSNLTSIGEGFGKIFDKVSGGIYKTRSIEAIASSLSSLSNAGSATSVLNSFASFLDSLTTDSDATKIGSDFVGNIISGVETKTESLKTSVGSLLYGARLKANEYPSKFYSIGERIGQGMANGILAKKEAVKAAMVEVCTAAAIEAKISLEIHSPSKVFSKIGEYVDLGFAKGITDNSDEVTDSVDGMCNTAAQIAQALTSDFDDGLTIRPVVDLSNVEASSDRISSLLGYGKALGVSGSINANKAAAQISDGKGNQNDVSGTSNSGASYSFVQNNYSPKALGQTDIYRQTKNQFSMLKGLIKA